MSLEEDLDLLTQLDEWRVRSAAMRDDGRRMLAHSFDRGQAVFWRRSKAVVIEKAMVLQAVLSHRRRPVPYPKRLVDDLERLSFEAVMDPSPDGVAVLRAAKAMCALAKAPSSALSPSISYFYYAIVRELYAADAPEWSMGGARAGEGMLPKAFVTWHCIRAILGLRDAIDHTATLIGRVASMVDQQLRKMKRFRALPPDWEKIDTRRSNLEFATTLQILHDNIALKLETLPKAAAFDTRKSIDAWLRAVRNEIENRASEFAKAAATIEKEFAFKPGSTRKSDKRAMRLYSAHGVALSSILDAQTRAENALKEFDAHKDPVRKLELLEKQFRQAAVETAKILHPATNFVLRVLNRELAGAALSSSPSGWDAGEMAFAAVAYGEATQRWNDERLRRAGEHLSKMLSERGRFPLGKPLHTANDGYQLHPLNAEVIEAVAGLLHHVQDVDLDPNVVKRMMAYFQDTQSAAPRGIWYSDEIRGKKQAERTASASAVLALDAINEMLDERINSIVFRHFSHRKPQAVKLPDLFYGDYGLVASYDANVPVDQLSRRRSESVAVLLERMRAHVCGVAVERQEALFSLVLHGPPGTGKTMLIEALAASCGVTLVEVTPSDIVIGGADAIERRARAVFKALSLVTRAVILFDEFDPVLLKRTVDEKNPSVFSFLTPGMLPKLKWLHDRAQERSVAYALITNLIDKLDDAAIRNGRFDARIGIYPPDVLSRFGRLYHAIGRYTAERTRKRLRRLPKPEDKVVFELVRNTGGGPMSTLGKPGWFTVPELADEAPAGQNAFARLYGKCDEVRLAAEAKFDYERPPNGNDAIREWYEWLWIRLWDECVAQESCKTMHRALKKPPTQTQLKVRYDEEVDRRLPKG